MSDFERQLREAMSAMVADAEPPPAVMERVRRRHRRHNAWLAAAGVVVVAAVVAVAPVVSALRKDHRGTDTPRAGSCSREGAACSSSRTET